MRWKSFIQQLFSWRCFLVGTGVGALLSAAFTTLLCQCE